MSNLNVFKLSYTWYEDYSDFLFLGPENYSEYEFKNLCDDLLPRAISNALKLACDEELQDRSYIGMFEIIQEIAPLLEDFGFKIIEPRTANYGGSGIIKDVSDLSHNTQYLVGKFSEVMSYNLEIRNRYR